MKSNKPRKKKNLKIIYEIPVRALHWTKNTDFQWAVRMFPLTLVKRD